MSSITIAYDATHDNIGRLPENAQAVGYWTGGPGVLWTAADRAAHPGAVQVCQDAGATYAAADVLDVERGAATTADVGPWAHAALESRRAAARAGQRSPLIYANASMITPVANALVAARLDDGSVGLFVANWSLTRAQAVADVLAASGPFPIRGIQFSDDGPYDVDVFETAWLSARSV